jgi:hypothetical protein
MNRLLFASEQLFDAAPARGRTPAGEICRKSLEEQRQ